MALPKRLVLQKTMDHGQTAWEWILITKPFTIFIELIDQCWEFRRGDYCYEISRNHIYMLERFKQLVYGKTFSKFTVLADYKCNTIVVHVPRCRKMWNWLTLLTFLSLVKLTFQTIHYSVVVNSTNKPSTYNVLKILYEHYRFCLTLRLCLIKQNSNWLTLTVANREPILDKRNQFHDFLYIID